MAHARLSIIDLSAAAAQPMRDPERGNVLVFNGEIYNYKELRSELTDYPFRSQSDTEVLLAAYRKWGSECPRKFRGMFAFALWDAQRNEVFLARDRIGIKPLYYRAGRDFCLFASEIKALVGLGEGLRHRMNERKVLEFLCSRILNSDEETCFREVNQVAPGTSVWLQPSGRLVRPARYWTIPRPGDAPLRAGDPERVREKLCETVRLHLRSDVPLGCFVSGGLDSSTLTCLAAESMGGPSLHLFSSRLTEPTEENALIPLVQAATGGTPHELWLSGADFLDDAARVAEAHDEPYADASMWVHYRICKLAREQGVKVLLGGNGGDEVFGGYASHAYAYFGHLLRLGRLIALRRAIMDNRRQWAESHGHLWLRALQEALPPAVRMWRKRGQRRLFLRLLNPDVPTAGIRFFFNTDPDPVVANYVNNFCHWTVPQFLQYEDRNSMAWGVEVRVPMLDHELVELVAQFSPGALVHGRTKSLLRKAMAGVVPEAVLNQRRKFAFAAPLDMYLRRDRRASLELFAETVRDVPLFDYGRSLQAAREYLDAEQGGDSAPVWRTFTVAMWYKIFFTARGGYVPGAA